MNPVKLNPGNIYSGNRRLAVFTNPTELAFRKGNLRHHYPLKINNTLYPDAESAYQHFASGYKDDFAACKHICFWILEEKLEQYPLLIETISFNGGLDWISECRHIVYARTKGFKRWEGIGLQSAFIRCLSRAYTASII